MRNSLKVAKINLLVDTDIFIDYFNTGLFSSIIKNKSINIYYSIVTKKELLNKEGLKTSERKAIVDALKKFREVKLDNHITSKYSEIRNQYPLT